jgi:hypothetical protein
MLDKQTAANIRQRMDSGAWTQEHGLVHNAQVEHADIDVTACERTASVFPAQEGGPRNRRSLP